MLTALAQRRPAVPGAAHGLATAELAMVESQRYVVTSALVQGERVAIEVTGSARLELALGQPSAGDTMTAESALFFRVRDGRLAEQHNFDCFEPF